MYKTFLERQQLEYGLRLKLSFNFIEIKKTNIKILNHNKQVYIY